ncbi:hypothetical protein Nepgr_015165 [Nepenthes gracilis]|uniref:Uncharacterized protein n=1 Tax=Nepenthes gracilis TaxID=150966 RepID=A0AAD3SME5_NEPGR|nr:hypothetical protein Nepgr_015165 [Nepenthes gracilis]
MSDVYMHSLANLQAHMAPGSEGKLNFPKYISKSLEQDFKDVAGISPIMWLFSVLFSLAYTNVLATDIDYCYLETGWYSYHWLPFIPLIVSPLRCKLSASPSLQHSESFACKTPSGREFQRSSP